MATKVPRILVPARSFEGHLMQPLAFKQDQTPSLQVKENLSPMRPSRQGLPESPPALLLQNGINASGLSGT